MGRTEQSEEEYIGRLHEYRQTLLRELSAQMFLTDYPQPAALLALNLAKDTLEAWDVLN